MGAVRGGKPIENTERMICLMLSLLLGVKASPYYATRGALSNLLVAWRENLVIFNVTMRCKR